jgi:hypothetical protein
MRISGCDILKYAAENENIVPECWIDDAYSGRLKVRPPRLLSSMLSAAIGHFGYEFPWAADGYQAVGS